jgi:hypothetical protein
LKLNLTKVDLMAAINCLDSIIKAGSQKEKDLKPNSLDFLVLAENRKVKEKMEYANTLMDKEGKEAQQVELNRGEVKVLIATMLYTSVLQSKVMEAYLKTPENDPKYKDEPGRRRADYMAKLEEKRKATDGVLIKLREAI